MNPSRTFILKPVATSLLMVAIMLAGFLAYRLLPIAALPQVDYPTIQVTTLYPGASPDVMTSSITAPLERQFGQMPGLTQMLSTNSGGASVITLQFNLSLSLDVAEQEVQAAINAANSFLPTDLPMPPIYSKVNPADAPIMTLAITSTSLELPKVEDLVDTRLAPKISQLPGVGLVTIAGGQRPAVRVQLNPNALASLGLNLDDVRTAISAANVNMAKGSFDGPLRASTIDANDQLKSAAEYKDIVIAWRNGAPIFVKDVAAVVDGAENSRLVAWANQTPAIILNIQRQPGANVIQTVDGIKNLLPQLRASLPNSVDVQLLSDRTTTIRASIVDVQWELMLAVALVVMVIFVFLRNVPATLIPGVAVPLSLIGTFGVMYLAGFSINNLTLMALTIASGFVVDDAIVMIENISRYVEEGESPLEAALKGSSQIGFTIISLTFSLIAVLIPLLFMGDVVGRLFREFAITLAVSILISAVVSLTLTPMMCAKLLRHDQGHSQHGFLQWSERTFDRITQQYAQGLNWVLDRQKQTLWMAMLTLALTVLLYTFIPKGFFPLQDTGMIQVITEAPQTISFREMGTRQQAMVDALLQDPAVESVSSFVGVDGINVTLNNGRLLVNLKPKHERDHNIRTILKRLQQRSQAVSGISAYFQSVQDLTIENRISKTQYQLSVQDANADELAQWVPRLVQRLQDVPILVDVASDIQSEGSQAFLEIDRSTAARMGITTVAIDNALYNAFGQRLISSIFTQSNIYRVVLEVHPDFKQGLSALDHIHVMSSSGTAVPLSAVSHLVEKKAPLSINHLGQFPSATISFDLASRASLGEAVDGIKQVIGDMNLPPSLETRFQGAASAYEASLQNTLWLILAAVITMYIVLGVLYESYIHPITILSTLPSAAVGALLSLMVSGTDLGIIAIIGIVLLIGIVKKNAIMMIDFALQAERDEGKAPREAIYEACLLRLRPILMTTMAALLGALPLMLGNGVGSELRHPLGLTMVGGLIVSQVLTLFTTPVIYLAFDRLVRQRRAA